MPPTSRGHYFRRPFFGLCQKVVTNNITTYVAVYVGGLVSILPNINLDMIWTVFSSL